MSEDTSKRDALPPAGRIAGIDYGTVRIGVAIADATVGIAGAHENYSRRSPELDAKYFQALVAAEGITRFVVGLPVHLDGTESAKSTEARAFGRWLGGVTGVPVDFFDERFTTTQAERILGEAGLSSKKRKARLDKLAAQIMLSAYLESRGSGSEQTESIDD